MNSHVSHATRDHAIAGAVDAATCRAALAGDADAAQRLFGTLAALPAMLRVKNARLGAPLRPHELEDVVQSTLLSLWQKLGSFDGRAALLYWAYGFGVVELRRAVERRGRRREQPIDADADAVASDARPDCGDAELLHAEISQLDPADAAVVRLRHLEALPFDAIAARLGIVVNTAKTRYYRALERLRRRLRATGGERP